ncbi:MAG TPA: sigma-70 family RNA polymerase sigma factor [Myxococcales bacterium]|nr:sigma-70 family RNA polymerase sigma factor [Myxococcales bacterium]
MSEPESEPLQATIASLWPDSAADPALHQLLRTAVQAAGKENPGIALDGATYLRHLASKLDRSLPVAQGLAALKTGDLYLACACLQGDPSAIAAFDRAHLAQVDQAAASLRLGPEVAAELKQVLRERLFTGPSPRIAEYGGRGDLGRWLRAAATRAGLDLLRARGREPAPASDALTELVFQGADPEIELMKRQYGDAFRAAMADAMASLEAEERNDLRLYYVDGLSLNELGNLHRVNASTISRRLARSRQRLLERTQEVLRQKLQISEAQVESILRLIGSQLDFSRSAFEDRPG